MGTNSVDHLISFSIFQCIHSLFTALWFLCLSWLLQLLLCLMNSVLSLDADDAWYLDSVAAATALWLVRRLDAAGDALDRRGNLEAMPLITSRQRTVIELVGQGYTNSEIARQVGYSVPTIKKDLQYIMTLCDVHDRRQVFAVAKRVGLI